MLTIIFFLILVPFTAICALFVNPKKEYAKKSPFYRRLLNVDTWFAMKVLRIKIEVAGAEKTPRNERFVLVGNHRSNYDPIVTWLVFQKYDLAFVSKADNFKIPIFGRIIRKCCFMAIDRENPKNALKTLRNASDLIVNDVASVAVYPEGTRNKTAEGVLPFHNGVFKIAQRANAPIVTVGIEGTEQIHKRTPWRKTVVRLEVLDVIPSDEVQASRTVEIGKRVETKLTEWLS